MQCKYWTVLFVYWRQRFFVLHGKSIFLPHVAVDAGAVQHIHNDAAIKNFTLKGQCHKIFDPNIFASNTLSGPLMNRIIQFYTFLFPFEDVCLQSLKFMCPHWQCGHGIFCLIFTLKSLRNLQNLPPMSSMSLFYLRSYITTMVTQCQKSQQPWWLSVRIVNNHGDSVSE